MRRCLVEEEEREKSNFIELYIYQELCIKEKAIIYLEWFLGNGYSEIQMKSRDVKHLITFQCRHRTIVPHYEIQFKINCAKLYIS